MPKAKDFSEESAARLKSEGRRWRCTTEFVALYLGDKKRI